LVACPESPAHHGRRVDPAVAPYDNYSAPRSGAAAAPGAPGAAAAGVVDAAAIHSLVSPQFITCLFVISE